MKNTNNKNLRTTDSFHMSNSEVAYYDHLANLMSQAEKMRKGTWKDFFRNFYNA